MGSEKTASRSIRRLGAHRIAIKAESPSRPISTFALMPASTKAATQAHTLPPYSSMFSNCRGAAAARELPRPRSWLKSEQVNARRCGRSVFPSAYELLRKTRKESKKRDLGRFENPVSRELTARLLRGSTIIPGLRLSERRFAIAPKPRREQNLREKSIR